jgi:DNA-binding Lrp family transcriptional regulator
MIVSAIYATSFHIITHGGWLAGSAGAVGSRLISARTSGGAGALAPPGRSRVVVQAYILIQTEVGKARDVALAIQDIAGVVRVDAVTGPYDVIVLTEARSVDELGKLIVSKVQYVPGITRTVTCSVVHL